MAVYGRYTYGSKIFGSVATIYGRDKYGTRKYGSAVAVIDIVNYTRNKISDEFGYDVCQVTFTTDYRLTSWEARADGSGHGEGILIGSGNVVEKGEQVTFDIDDEELISGDKQYRIAIYGRTGAGWST